MSKKSILVIDDEVEICQIMTETLEEKGYKVYSANNGVEGLKHVSDNKIDLIVLDLKMPRMDGYMFMEHLKDRWEKENRSFEFPQIIVLSAVESKEDLGLSKNMGASKFLTKPIKPSVLVATVEELI